jgi:hypothetical protein
MGAIEEDFSAEEVVAGVLDLFMNAGTGAAQQGIAADGARNANS